MKVHAAAGKLVSGLIYTLTADLLINNEIQENCIAKIWERTWLEIDDVKGGQTEISCPDGHHKKYLYRVGETWSTESTSRVDLSEAAKVLNTYLMVPDFT